MPKRRLHTFVATRNPESKKGKEPPRHGEMFGELKFLRELYEYRDGRCFRWWECECQHCERKTVCRIMATTVRKDRQKTCGCLHREAAVKTHTKHGNSPASGSTRTYRIWAAMKSRCSDPNHKNYRHYAGRGIGVCERWKKFDAFLEDVGEIPDGMEIDRIDNDKGYEPGNVRLATRAEQCRNMRKNIRLDLDGRSQVLQQWADELHVSPTTIIGRLRRGWDLRRALTERPAARRLHNLGRKLDHATRKLVPS